jgi:hypothetical protein
VNSLLCYDCAFKHLSDAAEVWVEIENGYSTPDHYMKFVGSMSQAANHLIEKHKDLATEIREARKAWWDSKILGLESERPVFEKWAEKVWQLAVGATNGEERT